MPTKKQSETKDTYPETPQYDPKDVVWVKCRAGDKTCPGQQSVRVQLIAPLEQIPGIYCQPQTVLKCITCNRRYVL